MEYGMDEFNDGEREQIFNRKNSIELMLRDLAAYVQNPVKYNQDDFDRFSEDYRDTLEELDGWTDSISLFMLINKEDKEEIN